MKVNFAGECAGASGTQAAGFSALTFACILQAFAERF
jgi:hypothetical protein